MPHAPTPTNPSLATFTLYWLRLGWISFGGPAGQIAMMQTDLVDRRGWIDQTRFLHALNFCMLLPGPEAQQLATYVGWRMFGTTGGLIAGILFVLPGAAVLMLLSYISAAHGSVPAVAAVFDGVKPVVVAVIVGAVWRIGRRTLHGWPAVAVATAAFLGLYLFAIPFPLVVLTAALTGLAATQAGRDWFRPVHPIAADAPTAGPVPSGWRLARLAALFSLQWAIPVAGVLTAFGWDPFAGIAALFTKAAFLTFGGAYAVLPYVAEAAVHHYQWLAPSDMINGLALAESTPGPLILVTQYVGFFAGWTHALAHPGGLDPALAGLLGALLTLYVTFLPCFLFIFAGAPYVERLIHNRTVAGALSAVTAAVVGVILNLGVILALQVLRPHPGLIDGFAAVLALISLVTLLAWQVPVHWLIAAAALAGLAHAAAVGQL